MVTRYFHPYAPAPPENLAPNTPAAPTGPSTEEINVDCEFWGVTTDPNMDQIAYQFDWGDETFSEWTNYVASGVSNFATHQWSVAGSYNVLVRAKDVYGLMSPWSPASVIEITSPEVNLPPLTPSAPSGPSSGGTNIPYEFSGTTTDPNSDNVSYQFDWGDETFSEWTSFVASGQSNSASHQWTAPGIFNVKVRAKDPDEAISPWSSASTIEITEGVTPASIPMIAWPASFPGSLSYLKQFTDLGINALMCYDMFWKQGWQTNTAYVAWIGECFDRAAEVGVKLYCYINNATDSLSADDGTPFITKFKGKSACAGWFIYDEPHCDHVFAGYTMPEELKQYYPYLSTFSWGSGGHNLMRMLYDKIRGQDNDPTNHPAFPVWLKGFWYNCDGTGGGGGVNDLYATTYTPGGEILDVGSIDIYPAGNNWAFLDHWVNHSCEFPNNDGFQQLGKGMIPVIDAWTDGAANAPLEGGKCNLVNQCIHWEVKYPLPALKGVGFWHPGHFLPTTGDYAEKAAKLRPQIKQVCRKYGWGG